MCRRVSGSAWDAARDDPEMAARAAELVKAGFSQQEARSLVLKEWQDPALAKIRELEQASKRA